MRVTFLTLIILLNCITAISQNIVLNKFSVTKKDDELFGVKGEKGNILIPAIYQRIEIKGNYIRAIGLSSVSYFNSQGKLLAKYCDINQFQYGIYIISVCEGGFKSEYGELGYQGIMNEKGQVILAPNKFTNIKEFNKYGLAVVQIDSKNKTTYGLIDTLGKTIAECKYEHINSYASNNLIQFQQNGKCGYMNLKGEEVIKAKYDYAFPFKDGQAEVTLKGPPVKKITIDSTGKEIKVITY